MSRLSGFAALGAAAAVLLGSTTAVAIAATQDEVAEPTPTVQQHAPAYPAVTSSTAGYGESEPGHHHRRGRGHGSGRLGSDEHAPHS